ncbi:MAG: peptide deformylase [Desulfobacteraceae bacterium]|jgi:peptide deformylase
MTVREVLLLGNPTLYEISEPVRKQELTQIAGVVTDLHDTLMAFRARYGVGRAIAAPQLGVMKRLIYMHIDEPLIFINPILDRVSEEMMEVWDDCMCFPELLVKVRRHKRCHIGYQNMDWGEEEMWLEDDLSELVQHEIDHLDGILAISRAIDSQSFALRSQKAPRQRETVAE